MFRIWAKVMKKDKILKQCVYEDLGAMDYDCFFDYLSDICARLEIPTPVLIKTHLFNYAKYNNVKFKKDDFVENIDFDRLILENAFI